MKPYCCTNAPDVLSPLESILVSGGDYTISEAMIARSVARIRCHAEGDAGRYLRDVFGIADPHPGLIADLTDWD